MTNPTHHPNWRKWYSVIALFAEIPTEQAEKILEKIVPNIFNAGRIAGLDEAISILKKKWESLPDDPELGMAEVIIENLITEIGILKEKP